MGICGKSHSTKNLNDNEGSAYKKDMITLFLGFRLQKFHFCIQHIFKDLLTT